MYDGYVFTAIPGVQCYGPVARELGAMATLTEQWDAAAAHFESALAMCDRLQSPPWKGWSYCQYADMLVRRGVKADLPRARQLLRAAAEIAESLEMHSLTRDVNAVEESMPAPRNGGERSRRTWNQ